MIKKQRESNFELLRIICMFMIVGLHILAHGGSLYALNPNNINYYIINIIESFFIVSVNCYVLISGYFRIKANFPKLVKLELQILFYSISIPLFLVIIKVNNFSKIEIIKFFMPVISKQWWFVTIYVILFLLSPFINILVDNLNEDNYKKLLIFLFTVFIIWPTFSINSINNDKGFGLYSFIFLYLVGSFVRKYHNSKKNNKFLYLKIYLITTMLIFLCTLVSTILHKSNNYNFYNYDSIFVFISSVALFLFFKELKFKSKFINKISKLVFAVYLIHDNSNMSAFIFKYILNFKKLYYNKFILFYIFYSTIIIFIVCICIEFLRTTIFNILETKIISLKIIKKINNKIFPNEYE